MLLAHPLSTLNNTTNPERDMANHVFTEHLGGLWLNSYVLFGSHISEYLAEQAWNPRPDSSGFLVPAPAESIPGAQMYRVSTTATLDKMEICLQLVNPMTLVEVLSFTVMFGHL